MSSGKRAPAKRRLCGERRSRACWRMFSRKENGALQPLLRRRPWEIPLAFRRILMDVDGSQNSSWDPFVSCTHLGGVTFLPYGNRKAVKKVSGGHFLGRGRFPWAAGPQQRFSPRRSDGVPYRKNHLFLTLKIIVAILMFTKKDRIRVSF